MSRQIITTSLSYIAPFMAVFLMILAFFLYPREFMKADNGNGCQAGESPAKYEEISMIPFGADWSTEEGSAARTPFVKIRENIPITTDLTAFCPQLYSQSQNTCVHFTELRMPGFEDKKILYPREAAEHNYMNSILEQEDSFFPLKEHVIFLMHMEGFYSPKILTVRAAVENNSTLPFYEKILLADAYQEKTRYQQVMSGLGNYTYNDVFKCDRGGPLPKLTDEQIQKIINTPGFNDPENPVEIPELENLAQGAANKILIPPQSPSSDNQQLQLEWFVLDQSQGAWDSHCKPAVYLYPPKKMQVNVKVFPAGTLTYTDPIYDSKSGWTVDAYPDGKIYDSRFAIYDKPFDYLYFESKVPDHIIQKPTKGWVIQSSVVSHQSSADTTDWFIPLQIQLETLLPQLGLNQAQTKDFVDYWKKALPYSPYYFIGIIDQTNVDQIERLEITPKPDHINRVRIYFERLDAPKSVEEPTLPTTYQLQPTNFNVVEWGGMVKNDPNHPFTCSQ